MKTREMHVLIDTEISEGARIPLHLIRGIYYNKYPEFSAKNARLVTVEIETDNALRDDRLILKCIDAVKRAAPEYTHALFVADYVVEINQPGEAR